MNESYRKAEDKEGKEEERKGAREEGREGGKMRLWPVALSCLSPESQLSSTLHSHPKRK